MHSNVTNRTSAYPHNGTVIDPVAHATVVCLSPGNIEMRPGREYRTPEHSVRYGRMGGLSPTLQSSTSN